MQNLAVETIMFPCLNRHPLQLPLWKQYCNIWKAVESYQRIRAVFVWILIWDENVVVIDTKTTYFVNKSDFQYKIMVVRGRDIDFFRHYCRSVLKNHRNLGKKNQRQHSCWIQRMIVYVLYSKSPFGKRKYRKRFTFLSEKRTCRTTRQTDDVSKSVIKIW